MDLGLSNAIVVFVACCGRIVGDSPRVGGDPFIDPEYETLATMMPGR